MKGDEISSKVRNSISDLEGPSYSSLPADILRMNDNSNLFAPNPAVKNARDKFDFDLLSSYPTVLADDLREAIAQKFRIDPMQVIVGNGSDEIIDLAVKAFLDPGDTVALPVPTFEIYTLYVKVMGASVAKCPLKGESFDIDVDAILSSEPKVVFICSPNNPTGNAFAREDFERVLNESRAMVVMDEAYCQFSDKSGFGAELVKDYDNLIVLRTFSKAYSLAGLRVGFGVGSEEAITPLRKIIAPFRLNRFSEAVAIEALNDDDFIERIVTAARDEREYLTKELSALGAKAYPSEANFMLLRSPIPVKALVGGLLERGIAIRDCSAQPLLEDCARVTIGNRGVNIRFIGAMKRVLEESQ